MAAGKRDAETDRKWRFGHRACVEGSKQLLDYASTKGAINAFTKSLAQNVLQRGIRVNAVAPVCSSYITGEVLPVVGGGEGG